MTKATFTETLQYAFINLQTHPFLVASINIILCLRKIMKKKQVINLFKKEVQLIDCICCLGQQPKKKTHPIY